MAAAQLGVAAERNLVAVVRVEAQQIAVAGKEGADQTAVLELVAAKNQAGINSAARWGAELTAALVVRPVRSSQGAENCVA